jgi:hypothetical protein
VVSAERHVVSDPPFSRVSLISCRNPLLNLSAELQRRVLPTFHHALNPDGFLFPGVSESIGDQGALFAPLDRVRNVLALKDSAVWRHFAGVYTQAASPAANSERDDRIVVLERELRGNEEYLQSTVEELETANEELTSMNEELTGPRRTGLPRQSQRRPAREA